MAHLRYRVGPLRQAPVIGNRDHPGSRSTSTRIRKQHAHVWDAISTSAMDLSGGPQGIPE